MFSTVTKVALLLILMLPVSAPIRADFADNHAHLRFIQLVPDIEAISIMLEDERTVITDMTPGTTSAYMLYEVNRSGFLRLNRETPEGTTLLGEYIVPPLSSGYHTAVIMGNMSDDTVELIFVDEGRVCEGKLEAGACVILVNNIKSTPPLSFTANNVKVIDNAPYRHVIVNDVLAMSYEWFIGADTNNPTDILFNLQQAGAYEPNTIYFYGLVGRYPGELLVDYGMAVTRRVPVDIMTFLRGLRSNLNLTDGETFFSLENIVAILDEMWFGDLLANQQQTFTVFAPTDDAILAAPVDIYACVRSNPEALRALILNHILVGTQTTTELVKAGTLPTMAGTTHSFFPAPNGFYIDNQIQVSDSLGYSTINGNVYLVDRVLIPVNFKQEYCTEG